MASADQRISISGHSYYEARVGIGLSVLDASPSLLHGRKAQIDIVCDHCCLFGENQDED